MFLLYYGFVENIYHGYFPLFANGADKQVNIRRILRHHSRIKLYSPKYSDVNIYRRHARVVNLRRVSEGRHHYCEMAPF